MRSSTERTPTIACRRFETVNRRTPLSFIRRAASLPEGLALVAKDRAKPIVPAWITAGTRIVFKQIANPSPDVDMGQSDGEGSSYFPENFVRSCGELIRSGGWFGSFDL